MRVILVGTAAERRRLRTELDEQHVEVVAEFDRLPDAEAAAARADAIVLATPERSRSENREEEWIAGALTPRELDVLQLLAEGLPNKAIADRLGISDQTVKFHLAAIFGKLGASNRTDAVRRALRRGLITV